MKFKVNVSTIYNCSIERAYKTPMLCDIRKVHTGYGFSPRVTHTTEDSSWGKVGSHKKIYVAKSLTQSGGFAYMDRVLERVENKYWKIQVDDFQIWMLGFYKFVGEWRTTEIKDNEILVEYSYFLHANVLFYYPLNWLFAKTFWPMYMKKVLSNIKIMAENDEPYLYE